MAKCKLCRGELQYRLDGALECAKCRVVYSHVVEAHPGLGAVRQPWRLVRVSEVTRPGGKLPITPEQLNQLLVAVLQAAEFGLGARARVAASVAERDEVLAAVAGATPLYAQWVRQHYGEVSEQVEDLHAALEAMGVKYPVRTGETLGESVEERAYRDIMAHPAVLSDRLTNTLAYAGCTLVDTHFWEILERSCDNTGTD